MSGKNHHGHVRLHEISVVWLVAEAENGRHHDITARSSTSAHLQRCFQRNTGRDFQDNYRKFNQLLQMEIAPSIEGRQVVRIGHNFPRARRRSHEMGVLTCSVVRASHEPKQASRATQRPTTLTHLQSGSLELSLLVSHSFSDI